MADGEMAAAPEGAGGDKSPQKPAAAKRQPMSLRRHIYATLEDPSYSELAKWTSVFMMVIILLSTVCFVLESEAENPDGIIDEYPATWVFYYVEWVSVVLFRSRTQRRLSSTSTGWSKSPMPRRKIGADGMMSGWLHSRAPSPASASAWRR